MIWGQIVYFIVTLVLSIALSPKPQKPRSAALDDFEFPTAEEGRPIPVIFGEVDITGPNVLWYGDLDVRAIKKRSGFSKATVGYKYYIGFHAGVCTGEIDAVTRIAWGDKTAWTGSITANGSGSINQPDLFGGANRGGGLIGDFDIAFGGDGQTPNAYLTTALGETPPAFRGIVSFIWKAGYIGNSEFVKPFAIRCSRILKGWDDAVWYSAKADVNGGMNAAHVLYQVLTDTRWGMGVSTALINDTNFRAAADELYDEGMGLHMIWNQSTTIEQFIEIVLNHIAGGLTFNLSTGLYELSLFRGGYNPDDLNSYDSDESRPLKFEKQGWGETVNEVTLTYTDPDTRNPTTITAQDLASVESQGARIPALIDLKGIRDHELARVALGRELAQRTMPLTKLTFEINRRAWSVQFGELFKYTWVDRQCVERVFRVLKISKGTLQSNMIRIEALEDIYQYSVGIGLDHQEGSSTPTPPTTPPDDDSAANNVVSATTTAPPSASQGDRYIVPPGATGVWGPHVGELAEYDPDDEDADAEGWVYTPIPDGEIVYVEDDDETVQIIGGNVEPFGGGGGSISVGDVDSSPDIEDVTTIVFDGASVTEPVSGTVLVTIQRGISVGDVDSSPDLEEISTIVFDGASVDETAPGIATITVGQFLEPVANGDVDDPEVVFADGDIVFVERDLVV